MDEENKVFQLRAAELMADIGQAVDNKKVIDYERKSEFGEIPYLVNTTSYDVFSKSVQSFTVRHSFMYGFSVLNPFLPPGAYVVIDDVTKLYVKPFTVYRVPIKSHLYFYIPVTIADVLGTWAISGSEKFQYVVFKQPNILIDDFSQQAPFSEFSIVLSVSGGGGELTDTVSVLTSAVNVTLTPTAGAGFIDPFNSLLYSDFLFPRYTYKTVTFVGVNDPYIFSKARTFKIIQDSGQAGTSWKVQLYA